MKAILVIDMPETCEDCPIRFSGEPNEWCWYMKHGLDDVEEKPSWCPLKPLPQKKNATKEWVKNTEDVAEAMKIGWNACLEEIEE